MSRGRRAPRLVIDYDRCIRVPDEDRRVASKSVPYKCVWCEREDSYNGVLRFEGESIPVCRERHEVLGKGADKPLMVAIR